jgi:hypothetical protein
MPEPSDVTMSPATAASQVDGEMAGGGQPEREVSSSWPTDPQGLFHPLARLLWVKETVCGRERIGLLQPDLCVGGRMPSGSGQGWLGGFKGRHGV